MVRLRGEFSCLKNAWSALCRDLSGTGCNLKRATGAARDAPKTGGLVDAARKSVWKILESDLSLIREHQRAAAIPRLSEFSGVILNVEV